MHELEISKYLIDPSKPRRKTRYRVRKIEKSIAMLECIRDFACPKDLANMEETLKHYKDVINDKKLRYPDSLELYGIKKDISDIQQKIHLNKELIRRSYAKLVSMKSYLRNAKDSFKEESDIHGAVYSNLKLKIIKSKKEIQDLTATLINLGKEQSTLKKDLKLKQRSLTKVDSDKEKENG